MIGRWPANVILSPDTAALLDEQSGSLKSPKSYTRKSDAGNAIYGAGMGNNKPGDQQVSYGDEGGASKFFLTAGYEQWELEWIYSVGLRPCGTEQA